MTHHQQSLVQLHLAVLLFGGTALFSKLIGLSALDITFYRTTVAAICLFVLLLSFKRQILLNNSKDLKIALLLGVLVGLHWYTYFASMQMAGIAVGMISFFTYPVITVFIEPLFQKSRPKIADIFSGLVVITGIYLLVPEADLGNDMTLGIIIGVFSGGLFSLRNIIHKKSFSQYSGPQTMMYQCLIAALMFCLFIDVPPAQVSDQDWWYIIMAGAIFTAVPHALFASSLQNLSATTAGLISCLQPLYGTLLAFALLAEKPALMTIVGGTLVVSAAIFETWSVSKKRHNL